MNSPRRLFYLSLSVVIGILALVAAVNYITDPYSIFRTDYSYQFVQPARNFIKMRYLGQNPGKYDCFLFGSSRVDNIDVTKINGMHCYDAAYSEGLPREHLDNIRYLLRKGAKIKLILLGLDEFSYKVDPETHLDQPIRQPYPPVIGESSFLYYLRYLLRITDKRIRNAMLLGYIAKRKGTPNGTCYDLFGTGRILAPNLDRFVESHRGEWVKDPKFDRYDPCDHCDDRNMMPALRDLKAIVNLTRRNGIGLITFINPIHRNVYMAEGPEGFCSFKRELSGITDFYDFSGLNAITTDNFYYYEPVHYRSPVGDMMLAKMLGYPSPAVPSDFGVLVTKDNIESHLKDLRKQLASLYSKGDKK